MLLSQWASSMSREQFNLASTLMWASWMSRNKNLFEDSSHDPPVLAARMVQYASAGPARNLSATAWRKPSAGIVKINVDAALFHNAEVGLGVVARDHRGKILFTAAKRLVGSWDPSVVEAAAFCYGVELARRFNHHDIWGERCN